MAAKNCPKNVEKKEPALSWTEIDYIDKFINFCLENPTFVCKWPYLLGVLSLGNETPLSMDDCSRCKWLGDEMGVLMSAEDA